MSNYAQTPPAYLLFNSGLFNANTLEIIVNETKSLYFNNSVAVNVERASTNNSQARLNWRIDNKCRPL